MLQATTLSKASGLHSRAGLRAFIRNEKSHNGTFRQAVQPFGINIWTPTFESNYLPAASKLIAVPMLDTRAHSASVQLSLQ